MLHYLQSFGQTLKQSLLRGGFSFHSVSVLSHKRTYCKCKHILSWIHTVFLALFLTSCWQMTGCDIKMVLWQLFCVFYWNFLLIHVLSECTRATYLCCVDYPYLKYTLWIQGNESCQYQMSIDISSANWGNTGSFLKLMDFNSSVFPVSHLCLFTPFVSTKKKKKRKKTNSHRLLL